VSPLLLLLACTSGADETGGENLGPDSGGQDSQTASQADSGIQGRDSGQTGQSACEPIDGPGGQGPLLPTLSEGSNLLILSIDTLRKDRVGRYSGLDTTPFLDEWLDGSLVLEAHRSCSDWTASSMLCALTGTTPTEAGYEPHAGTDTVLIDVPLDLETLTSWLMAAGRIPAIVTANGVVAETQPSDLDPRAVTLLDRQPAADIVDAGLTVLDSLQASEAPWFLHLHFNDPHSPYDPPSAYLSGLDDLDPSPVDLTDEAAIIALSSDPAGLSKADQALVIEHTEIRYQGELRYLDDQLRRLWQELELRSVPQDTLIVLFSDHGEQFFEHGAYTHGMTLYAEEVDAIAALRAPGLDAGTWSGPTAHQDLVPTILGALGIEAPSLVTAPVLGTAPADRSRHGFRQYRDVPPLQVLTRGSHRLFYEWSGERSFHDLETDPVELNDIYDPLNADLLCLWEQLIPWIEQAQTFLGDYEPVEPNP
jgi:arylsulfatase A-like enzyme